MRSTRKLKALGIVAMLVLFGATLAGLSKADPAGGSFTDTNPAFTAPPTGTAVDIVSVSHKDDGSNITWSVHTRNPFDNTNDFFRMTWNLDLNSNGTYCEAGVDASIQLSPSAGALVASLKPGCGAGNGSATATTSLPAGGGEDITFSFDNQQFRNAVGFATGTSYRYKVTNLDNHGNSETIPQATDTPNYITHSNIFLPGQTPVATASPTPSPTPTPTPCAGCATATATQTETVTVSGVLSIVPQVTAIPFGTIIGGQSVTGVAVGRLDYTDTLFDAPPAWNVAVVASKFTRNGTAPQPTISYTNETFSTAGSSIAPAAGASGGPASPGPGGQFTGSGTVSDPVTVATAPTVTYGTYQHSGNTLSLSVPLSTNPGQYTGTLTYTITG